MQWVLEPFIHLRGGHLYNPLTDLSLNDADPVFPWIKANLKRRASLVPVEKSFDQRLSREGWVVRNGDNLFRRFRLTYATIETHSACNQRCFFCPVSVSPRDLKVMPKSLFAKIAESLAEYRNTLKGVFLFSYNEPTTDPCFLERIEILSQFGLQVAINTNGSGLTPKVVDRIEQLGGLAYLSVNLSTMDRAKYAKERGADHLELVLRNLEYAGKRAVASQMVVTVLGGGDAEHDQEAERIKKRFSKTRFAVSRFTIMNRAGQLAVGARPDEPCKKLARCENMGSRPVQHLHVAPDGMCLLCCQDYFGKYTIGNLTTQSIHEAMTSEASAQLRAWVYGVEEAPEDFLCRSCIYAKSK